MSALPGGKDGRTHPGPETDVNTKIEKLSNMRLLQLAMLNPQSRRRTCAKNYLIPAARFMATWFFTMPSR